MKDLVTKEVALLAESVGFNIDTVFAMNNSGFIISKLSTTMGGGAHISWDRHDTQLRLPTYRGLQRWLLEQHNIVVNVHDWGGIKWYSEIKDVSNNISERFIIKDSNEFNSHDKAMKNGLIKALNMI